MNRSTGWGRRPRRRQGPSRARLELERLEDRTLPSGLTLTPLVPVSGPDPITNNNDLTLGQRGTVYLGSTVEPQVAVDPSNPANVVAVWQQDRWSTGGARALAASVSTDGGASWGPSVVIPGFSLASGNPDYLRASDPWVSWGADGHIYVSGLSATLGPAIPVPSASAVVATTATLDPTSPGGIRWGTPSTLLASTSPFPLDQMNDKESITADPNDPTGKTAYVVWDQLDFPSNQADLNAYHAGAAIRENLFFSKTTDGGATWTAAQNVTNFQDLKAAFGNQIVVEPDGTLLDVCTLISGSGKQPPQAGQTTLAVLRSTDGGKTWSTPILGPAEETIAVTDPDTGQPVRDGESLLDVAVDPRNGNLYAVWADGRFSNFSHEDIAFSQSTDGGRTWTDPIKVNQTPTNILVGDQQAFTPSVAVAADGTVAVTYYDFRNNTTDPGLTTDYWLVHASGNLTDPASWQSDEKRLTSQADGTTGAPFDMENAPGRSLFLGDYQGLSAAGNSFYALFVEAGSTPGTAGTFFRDPPPAPESAAVPQQEGGAPAGYTAAASTPSSAPGGSSEAPGFLFGEPSSAADQVFVAQAQELSANDGPSGPNPGSQPGAVPPTGGEIDRTLLSAVTGGSSSLDQLFADWGHSVFGRRWGGNGAPPPID